MREKVVEVVFDAIDQINKENKDRAPLEKSMDTVLFGSNSQLDSLGLINLVVSVEQGVEESFQKAITLADDRALSQEVSPFTNVGTLVGYVENLLTHG